MIRDLGRVFATRQTGVGSAAWIHVQLLNLTWTVKLLVVGVQSEGGEGQGQL